MLAANSEAARRRHSAGPALKSYTNFDNYVPLTNWTKIAINNTEYNDQGAFDAANNRFVAPLADTYLFGASLLYKVNASTTARMNGRLVLNGPTEIKGGKGEDFRDPRVALDHPHAADPGAAGGRRHRRAAGVLPRRRRLPPRITPPSGLRERVAGLSVSSLHREAHPDLSAKRFQVLPGRPRPNSR